MTSISSWGNSIRSLRGPDSTMGGWVMRYSSKSTGSTDSVRGTLMVMRRKVKKMSGKTKLEVVRIVISIYFKMCFFCRLIHTTNKDAKCYLEHNFPCYFRMSIQYKRIDLEVSFVFAEVKGSTRRGKSFQMGVCLSVCLSYLQNTNTLPS